MVVRTNPEVLKRRREIRDPSVEWNLAFPTGVTFDPKNERLIIVDTQRNRLQIYKKLRGYTEPQRNL
jgi:sugar lactone lactonase YvrE